MGDILPNQQSFRFNRRVRIKNNEEIHPVELGNVTKKVQNAILSVLDMFFACKSNEYTNEQIQLLDNMGTIMEAHIKVLWNLKQAILYEKMRGTHMRKLHSHNHIGQHIRMFGPIISADTDNYESAHKFFTTGVWRGTSKRSGTLVKEMHCASVVQSYTGHIEFYATLLEEDGLNESLKQFGPQDEKDDLTINPFTNIADIHFIPTILDTDGIPILKGCGKKTKEFTESLFGHTSLPSIKHLSWHIKNYFVKEEKALWDEITKENSIYEFNIVRAASYEGDKDSGVGKGVIYAMYNKKTKAIRHDFVNVKVIYDDKNGQTTEGIQVAQVLSMIQLHTYTRNDKNKRVIGSTAWYFIVQYLKNVQITKKTSKPHNFHENISVLQWETVNSTGRFNVDMVSLDSIVGSAMIIPYFSFIDKQNVKNEKPITGKPSVNDTFWYVDRLFFDRSEWNELEVINNLSQAATLAVNNLQNFLITNIIPLDEEEESAEEKDDGEETDEEE